MKVLLADDLTTVANSLIVGLPAIIAAIYAGRIHAQIKTPSKQSIGKQVESSHLTAIANNMLLSKKGGPTKQAEPEELREHGGDPPQVPKE